jgi:hypothetical protein
VGKKQFLALLKRASQPLPKAKGKSPASDSYTEKQTRSRKN